jgi:hypothetical protein
MLKRSYCVALFQQYLLVHLPSVGIKGNSHFLMQEKNNQQIMDLAVKWLHEKGLDK